jgi:hypothetical protein
MLTCYSHVNRTSQYLISGIRDGKYDIQNE